MKKNTRKIKNKGFTLVEMMVSVAIFSVIMTMGIGTLLNMLNTYKISQKEKQAADSLGFVLETITRELRLGINYYSNPGPNNYSGFVHDGTATTSTETETRYLIGLDAADNRGYMIYSIENGVLYRTKILNGNISHEALTDISQVIIKKSRVRVLNTQDINGTKQPLVWMQLLAVAPGSEKERIIQTLVSQRVLDA